MRKLDSSLTRGLAVSQERLRSRRADWWTARIMFAAELLDADPMKLMDEVRRHGWVVSMIGYEWPQGLRTEDEPRIAYDRRFGPRMPARRE